ncbi:MAG: S9 family peptidase [Muribaculaceae bacterium]|nr:S9 family peptidase [Muribaculaceae bacterium]
MKRIIIAALLVGASASVAPLSAAQTVSVADLAHYVYPANVAASASLSFMPDGLSFLKIGEDGKTIDRYDVASGKKLDTVINVASTRGDRKIESIADYVLSPDATKMLVYEAKTPVYRHSFWAEYFIFDLNRNTLRPLSEAHPRQQAPVFSPDGRMVAFMADDNNIYIHKLDYGSEVAVTDDGLVNSIINGVPDWTYQEEFTTFRSMEWAPDNSTLAFLRYDETAVPAFSFTMYEGACNPMEQYALYPGDFTYKYPVAGERNSRVTLHSYDVDTRKIKSIDIPRTDLEYISSIHFGPESSQLIVTTLNREQNLLDIYRVNPRSAVAQSIHQERSSAWILPECYENIAYEKDGMVIRSDRTGFSHLYRIDYNGNDLGAITSGNYDVTAYYGCAPDGTRYYQSTENGPLNRLVCKIDRKGLKSVVSPAEGWSTAQFAPAMNFYVLNHSSSSVPPVFSLIAAGKEKKLRVLQDNADYAARFAAAPRKEFFTVGSAGETLNGWMIKPTDFSETRKYPVIMTQYSGPGSQEVTNRWTMDWAWYAATQGFIVVCVDGRGTGARGRKFEQIVYKNLGHYETIDQNAVLAHLQTLPFVDAARIGICGWSYGGYETLMCASSGAPYAAAVAIAPVTSWRYYDTVYAERYMQTPRQNETGYEKSAPVSRVDKLNCPLLLISGTADDNVHMSNMIELTALMISQDKWPDMLLFPNMNHSINGCNTRAVVYSRMMQFFFDKLGK